MQIVVTDDAEIVIEHYPEDWLAFVLFWAVAAIVLAQFFTRYVLNNSLSLTQPGKSRATG